MWPVLALSMPYVVRFTTPWTQWSREDEVAKETVSALSKPTCPLACRVTLLLSLVVVIVFWLQYHDWTDWAKFIYLLNTTRRVNIWFAILVVRNVWSWWVSTISGVGFLLAVLCCMSLVMWPLTLFTRYSHEICRWLVTVCVYSFLCVKLEQGPHSVCKGVFAEMFFWVPFKTFMHGLMFKSSSSD